MKAFHQLPVLSLLAALALLSAGCGDQEPGPQNSPQRNALPVPQEPGQGPSTTPPGQGPSVSAVLTYEVCQSGKGAPGTQCGEGASPCPGIVEIPLTVDKNGTATGSATLTQDTGTGLTLAGTVQLTQHPDGSYEMIGSVSDNLHPTPLAQQQVSGTGSLEQLPLLLVDSGKQAQGGLSYGFALNVGAPGSIPVCQKQPAPAGKPTATPVQQVPPAAPTGQSGSEGPVAS